MDDSSKDQNSSLFFPPLILTQHKVTTNESFSAVSLTTVQHWWGSQDSIVILADKRANESGD